jgi:hypothetical protein
VNRLDTPTLDRCETTTPNRATTETAYAETAYAETAHVESRIPQTITAQIDCCYRNTSDRMVILRCCGPTEFYLERVVFPFEMLSFRCPPQSEVEIWTHGLGGPELLETIHAEGLELPETTSMAPLHLGYEEQNPWWLQAI